jgi:hypothetical protein
MSANERGGEGHQHILQPADCQGVTINHLLLGLVESGDDEFRLLVEAQRDGAPALVEVSLRYV